MKAEPGSTFGPYEIVHSLGGGGMGDVYRARDLRLGRDLAIKFLREDLAGSRIQLHRFEREARAASALNHPSIITIYEVGEHDGHPYIAMEYVDGRRLRDLLSEGRVPVERGLEIAVALADALAAAHFRGIVHRDLKPENVMITAEGRVKILDFGLAKPFADPASPIDSNAATMPGVVIGTAGYMAPEQAKGIAADFRSDQFALGTMLYEIFGGRSPFRRGTSMETISAILRDTQRPLTELRPDVPDDLASVVDRCLQKDPPDRYASTTDLAHDLRQIHRRFTTGTQPLRAGAPRRRLFGGRGALLLASAGIALVLAALLFALRPRGEAGGAAGSASAAFPAERSVIVLPFRETSGDAQWQLIAEGMAETVSSRLGPVGGLQVIPPSSIPRDLNPRDVKELTKIFGATLAITTTISRAGEQRLRAAYSLINTATGVQIAGGTVNGTTSDLWGLEDQIAERLAGALEVETTVRSEGDLLSPEAQDRFLMAAGALQRYDDPAMLDEAVALLEPLAAANPRSALVHSALGRAYQAKYAVTLDAKLAEQAISTSRKASRLDGRLPEVHVTLGKLFNMTGKPEEATRELSRALELRPNDADALLSLAHAYERVAPEMAETTYKRAITRRPSYWAGYNHLGVYYYVNRRFDEAAAMFSKVVELTPDNSRGYTNLAGSLMAGGKFEEAIEPFRRATEIQPNDVTAVANLATGYYYVGRFEQARETYMKAVALSPNNPRFRFNLAETLRALGRPAEENATYGEGIRLALESLRVNPAETALHRQLILAYSRTGEPRRAKLHLRKALELAPSDADVMWYAALMEFEQGNQAEGVSWLAKAVEAGADPTLLAREEALRPFRSDPKVARLIDEAARSRGRG